MGVSASQPSSSGRPQAAALPPPKAMLSEGQIKELRKAEKAAKKAKKEAKRVGPTAAALPPSAFCCNSVCSPHIFACAG